MIIPSNAGTPEDVQVLRKCEVKHRIVLEFALRRVVRKFLFISKDWLGNSSVGPVIFRTLSFLALSCIQTTVCRCGGAFDNKSFCLLFFFVSFQKKTVVVAIYMKVLLLTCIEGKHDTSHVTHGQVQVFDIGLPRSGTRSVAIIFSKLGYDPEDEPEGTDKNQ